MNERPKSRNYDIAELKRRLNDRARDVAEYLLPGGHHKGHEWRAGSVAGEPGQSLGVHLSGPKVGLYCDFSIGEEESGDLLDLWQAARHVDLPTALTEIRQYLGLADSREHGLQRPQRVDSERKSEGAEIYAPSLWLPIWRETVEDGPHWAYLLSRLGRLPGDLADLRYHPRCPRGRDRLPAMVALMRDAVTNEPTGVHRTYLARPPDGTWGKADVQPNKMMLGRAAGSVVKLTPDEDVSLGLGLSEGVEDGLAIINSHWRPIWACLSAGSMSSFPVLNGIECLTAFCDGDSPGRKAAAAVVERWRQAGKEAVIAEPPDGVKDFGELGHAR